LIEELMLDPKILEQKISKILYKYRKLDKIVKNNVIDLYITNYE